MKYHRVIGTPVKWFVTKRKDRWCIIIHFEWLTMTGITRIASSTLWLTKEHLKTKKIYRRLERIGFDVRKDSINDIEDEIITPNKNAWILVYKTKPNIFYYNCVIELKGDIERNKELSINLPKEIIKEFDETLDKFFEGQHEKENNGPEQ